MEELRRRFTKAGQGHVFRFENQLSPDDRTLFQQQLEDIEVEGLAREHKKAVHDSQAIRDMADGLEPLTELVSKAETSAEQLESWKQLGYQRIADGRVAALVLAGGQGTRLGTVDPKGMYKIGPLSNKSLYHIQADRILKLQELAARATGSACVVIRWYIMTSEATDSTTKKFFAHHCYFGLKEAQVFFFEQGKLPCLTPEGKIILESPKKVSVAPNGNGGLYKALLHHGVLKDMDDHGVEYLYQYCIDNVLIKMVDPTFIGFIYSCEADCASKVVAKAYPEEPVGVLCLRNGKYGVVEYSEIDDETAKRLRPGTEELVFNAAHVCINVFRRDFLEDCATKYSDLIPYHIAKKAIPYVDDDGRTVRPTERNGWKLEKFIFDVFEFARRLVAFQVTRDEEFSPLKNRPGSGKDCPETCREMLSALHTSLVKKAGGSLEGEGWCEISGRVSYDGEGLAPYVEGRSLLLPLHLCHEKSVL